MKTNLWEKYSKEKRQQIEDFCTEYKDFLSTCKTERECISYAKKTAEENGFLSLEELMKNPKQLKSGDKVYAINMNKAIVLFVVGKQPLEKGINIVGAHIDSPRFDLKAMPFYESTGFCMLDTHYYGGIKKYQWTAQPMALHGVIVRKDGTHENIVMGEDDGNGFCFTDLLPHLEKETKREFGGEDLNLIAGNIAKEDAKEEKFISNVLDILKVKNISKDDFFSAEIEIVPSGKARDCGFDKSMIMSYGQDDRSCAFTSLKAILETKESEYSVMCMLVDKEEIGSVGATGMSSKYFENCIADIMNLCGQYSELNMRRCLNRSNMISADVTAAVDPNFPAPFNVATDAHLAKGISFNKYTGGRGKSGANDANPEFIAQLRQVLDSEDIAFQATEMGKVDQGGGGTIAYLMAKYGMNVIDAGIPVLNMHAPWEITSKVDVFEAYRAYKAFYKMKIKES